MLDGLENEGVRLARVDTPGGIEFVKSPLGMRTGVG